MTPFNILGDKVAAKFGLGLDIPAAKARAAKVGGVFRYAPISDLDLEHLDFKRNTAAEHAQMVESIKKHGIREPLLTERNEAGQLRVLDGSHRTRAAIEAG